MSVTFALLCYNQEKFIREALRGAFRQDYQPLEILISDDHSTDASFDILREEVANYSGPRTVRLVRNGENLGFENFARTAEAASGEFLIRASQWEALSLAGARAPSSAEYGVLSSPSSGGGERKMPSRSGARAAKRAVGGPHTKGVEGRSSREYEANKRDGDDEVMDELGRRSPKPNADDLIGGFVVGRGHQAAHPSPLTPEIADDWIAKWEEEKRDKERVSTRH